MKEEVKQKPSAFFKYTLFVLVGCVAGFTGYHLFRIIEYFIKPVSNPLMPIGYYKYIAFPYISFIPVLLVLLFWGIYLIRKKYFRKGYVVFYVIVLLLFYLSQNTFLNFFDSFNPYQL